jgi:hypothetical protein
MRWFTVGGARNVAYVMKLLAVFADRDRGIAAFIRCIK